MQRFKQLALEERTRQGALSRKEKKALRALLESRDDSESERAALRAWAFGVIESLPEETLDGTHISWLRDVVKLLSPVPSERTRQDLSRAYFSPGEECLRTIRELIARSKETLDICVFTITDDRITDAILTAHRRGVEIRVLTDDEKSMDRGSDVLTMQREGIALRMDAAEDHMHHKFAIFDDEIVLTGSYNWTRSAAMHNQENLIVSNDADLVESFCDEFDRLWELFA